MIKMYGVDEVVDMIENRPCAPNPKYDLLVKNHKFNLLMQNVQYYFGDRSVT